MDMSKRIKRWLYRSLDHDLRPRVKKKLDAALARSPVLRAERERILAQRRNIAGVAATSFGPLFAERVMSRIRRMDQSVDPFYEALKSAFRKFAVAGTILVILLLSYNLVKENSFNSEEIFFTADTTFENMLRLPLL